MKHVTLYAHWKKVSSRVLTSEEKKFSGIWVDNPDRSFSSQWRYIQFNADGTFVSVWSHIWISGSIRMQGAKITQKGNFKAINGKITTTNVKETYEKKLSGYGPNYENKAIKLPVMTYKLSDSSRWYPYNNGNYLHMDNVRYSGDETEYQRMKT